METATKATSSKGFQDITETVKAPFSKIVYFLSITASLSGFLFGYDAGVISGSILLIKAYFNLDTLWIQLILSASVASSILFATFGGCMSDGIGRRKTIMLSSIICITGAVLMSVSPSKEILLIGRVVLGVTLGFSSVTVPVYIAEVAPPNIRGTLQSWISVAVAMGFLVSSIIAGVFSQVTENGWRYMLGLAVIPASLQLFGFIFLPESPRWLIKNGYDEKAYDVLAKIHSTLGVEDELRSIRENVCESKRVSDLAEGSTLQRVIRTPHVRRALFIGAVLMSLAQLCGANTVTYYGVITMKMAGFSVTNSIWLAVIINSVNFPATFIGMYLIDRLGRKILLLASFVGFQTKNASIIGTMYRLQWSTRLTIGLAILATNFQLSAINSPPINVTETFDYNTSNTKCNSIYSDCDQCITDNDCGFCYDVTSNGSCLPVDPEETTRSLVGRCNTSDQSGSMYIFAYDYCPNDYGWMSVLGLVIFTISFSPGLGCVPWTVNSEIYPMWARGLCTSIVGATNWTLSLIITLNFLFLTEAITRYGTFWLFGGMCVLGFFFVCAFLPETRNKNLEEVEQLFMPSKSLEEEKVHLLNRDSLMQDDSEDTMFVRM